MAGVACVAVFLATQAPAGCAETDDPVWRPDVSRDDGGTPDDAAPPDDGGPSDDGTTPDDAIVRDDGTLPDTPTCPETPCRLAPQCGCPAGEKCSVDPSSTETNLVKACVPAGARDTSQTCTLDTECMVGTDCFFLPSESGAGTTRMCYRYCAGPSDCPEAGSYCLQLFETRLYPGACTHACDPISNIGCPSSAKCAIYQHSVTEVIFTDCSSDRGAGGPGSLCFEQSDCGIGTFCATSISECIQRCRNPPTGSCSLGRSCNRSDPPIVIGGVEYGYCY